MRKASSVFAVLATILLFSFAMSAPASADPNGPGNNGTVKVVNDGDDPMGADDRDNDPHVCHFHLYGFHFDKSSSGTWQIQSWAPTGNGTVVVGGTWTADATGQWAVAGPSLTDGHYKLNAKQNGTPGGEKQKVFWVQCSVAAPAASTPTPTPGVTGGTGATGNTVAATPTPAVAGFQQNNTPSGAVTPIVELPGGSNQQSPNTPAAVNGVQTAPTGVNGIQTAPSVVNGTQSAPVAGVQSLPSTSSGGSPALPLALLGLALMGVGGVLLRDPGSRS